ncbi:MAG: metal-dependent hydrolase [Gemmatales bacterium]
MAAFREHIMFSTVLGVGYAVGLKSMGYEPSHALLAGGLCGVAGMLPDLDSDSGKPVREMFGFLATVSALIFFHRMGDGDLEYRMLLAACLYLFIRFGFSYIFKQLTVHRGMCHSIPTALIAGLSTFLIFSNMEHKGSLAMAGGVLIGFLSHLVLDEIYAVGFNGLKLKVDQVCRQRPEVHLQEQARHAGVLVPAGFPQLSCSGNRRRSARRHPHCWRLAHGKEQSLRKDWPEQAEAAEHESVSEATLSSSSTQSIP